MSTQTEWEAELDALHANTPKVEAAPGLDEHGSFVGYLISVDGRFVGKWSKESGFEVWK